MSKDVKKVGEDGKIAIRNERRHSMDSYKKMHKAKEITDDELKEYEVNIQKIVDSKIKEIDKIVEAKSAELMEV